MGIEKLGSTDAFVVVDLDGAERSVGVVRLAPKVLVDGAELLARATTYAFATFGVRAGGASAGINAKPDDRDAAIAAFVEEVGPKGLHLSPGTGLTADDLAPLGTEPLDVGLAARGAVAAAAAMAGGFAGQRAAVVGDAWLDRIGPSWSDAGGGEIEVGGLDAGADVLFVAGKAGVLDHEAAEGVKARLVVPLTPVPVTAKADAALARADQVLVPDAVSCAAPLLVVADPDGGDPVERVAAVAGELAAAGPKAWHDMVERAETFLSSWQDALPFGRPLA